MRKGTVENKKLILEFHRTYLIMALGFVLTGYYLNLIVFTSLILVHEFGHCLVAKLTKFHVEKIIIYPYGGFTKIKDRINRDINEELLVATAGIIMQFFFYMVIFLLYKKGVIRDYTFNLYTMYNQQMIFFNMLPIYPLDGSKILNLLFSKYFNYYLSNNLTIIFSFITILVVAFFNIYYYNYSNVMIMFLLLRYLLEFYQKRKYLYHRFLLERFLYSIRYPKLKILKKKEKLYKNRTHLFYDGSHYIEEKDYLKKMFSK